MPLVYVTLAEGTTSQDQRAQIGDGIHRALVDVANVPEDDRFQVINEVPSTNLIYSPDYMGFGRTRSVMFIQIFFNAGPSRRRQRRHPQRTRIHHRPNPSTHHHGRAHRAGARTHSRYGLLSPHPKEK